MFAMPPPLPPPSPSPPLLLPDNDLHDRLLKEDTCDSINQSGQCGPGISSRGEFEKLRTKVNSLAEHGSELKHFMESGNGCCLEQKVSGDGRWLRNSVVDK